jgi:hypothetical protein
MKQGSTWRFDTDADWKELLNQIIGANKLEAIDTLRAYFKILTRQGSAAPAGPYNYVINGRMIAGFAMVAFPSGLRQDRSQNIHRQPLRGGVRAGSRPEYREDRRRGD